MANPNTPRGLQPYAYSWGAPYNGAVSTFYVPVGNGTALFLGDPVVFDQTTSDGNGVPGINIGQAGNHAISGVFMGRSNNAGQTTIPVLQSNNVYLPAAVAAYIYVAWDPNLLYWAQEDSVGGNMASAAGGGQLADLIAGAGSTITSFSGWQLDSSTLGSGHQLSVIQALQEADNVISATLATGQFAKWLVRVVDRLPVY